MNPVARNPPPLSANWHFRSASILLITPQLPTIQSIPEGRNQVPSSHFRCRFTRIYVTVEKKRRSQLPFHADFKTFSNKYLYCLSTLTLIHCHFHHHPVISITTHFKKIFNKLSHIKNVSTIYEFMLYLI